MECLWDDEMMKYLSHAFQTGWWRRVVGPGGQWVLGEDEVAGREVAGGHNISERKQKQTSAIKTSF